MFGKNSLLDPGYQETISYTELSTWKHGTAPEETIPLPTQK